MTKNELIEQMKKEGIEVNETMPYNYLQKLYAENKKAKDETQPEPQPVIETKVEKVEDENLKAAKALITQINSYGNEIKVLRIMTVIAVIISVGSLVFIIIKTRKS